MTSLVPMSVQEKAARQANLQLELQARFERSQALIDSMCASLRARLERRVNRVPAAIRTTTIAELLAPVSSLPPVAATKPPATILARSKPAPVAAPARKTRKAAVPATTAAAKKATATSPPFRLPATMKSKKRTSDDISGDDNKENPAVMPKKRVRAAQGAKATTTAPTRTTRAASRQKPEQILSPKNPNSRAKAAKAASSKTSTRQR